MDTTDLAKTGARAAGQVIDKSIEGQERMAQTDEQFVADAAMLSNQLANLRQQLFPPNRQKQLRAFSSGEAARLIGVSDGYLRQLSLSGDGPQPLISCTGRRSYNLQDVNSLRQYLARQGGAKAKHYLRRRDQRAGEQLQILAVANLKGGSGKTTTATHFAQYMALKGYRVLAIDLDPQGPMSTLFGHQPDPDLNVNTSIYGALRYDSQRVPLSSLILKTYFTGLDLVPGSLELQEFEHASQYFGRDSTGRELFLNRVELAIATVATDYDIVVLDCPSQLGCLTVSALCAATAVIVAVHPQMLDVATTSQFLFMTSHLLSDGAEARTKPNDKFLRYLITRYEPNDGPQTQMVAFLRSQFGDRVLTAPMINSTAISDAIVARQTLYEARRENFSRQAYERAIDSLSAVNLEIETLVCKAWGRAEQ